MSIMLARLVGTFAESFCQNAAQVSAKTAGNPSCRQENGVRAMNDAVSSGQQGRLLGVRFNSRWTPLLLRSLSKKVG
jgi:hypothetical protein